jgi:hypothetical protein
MSARLLLGLTLLIGCTGDTGTPTDPDPTGVDVASLQIVGGDAQRFPAGRRSPDPLVVQAFDDAGEPVADARIFFGLPGGEGALSQPQAITDSEGRAETFLLGARPGITVVRAVIGSIGVEFQLTVDRAAAQIVFEEGPGGTALPGSPHPDSIIRVHVYDTEGLPLAGQQVWFSWPGELRAFADTSDADGLATTVILPASSSTLDASLFAFILAFPEATGSTTRQFRRAASRAILVSFNGLRADALDRWAPPALLGLTETGTLVSRARTVSPTLTLPAHLSLLASVSPEGHGILSDALEFTPQMATLDPLFRRARRQGRTAHAFMSGEGPLQGFEEILSCRLAFGLDSLTLVPPSAAAAVAAAELQLSDPTIDLLFLHLPDPDLAGHQFGFDSPEYGAAVLDADEALAQILEGAAAVDSTLVIVVSDHGGGGAFGPYQHGSDAPEDAEIPIFISGGATVPGLRIETASILDVAPTILWALGIPVPSAYEGRTLREAFR